jgi:hypothetical protein
MNDMQPRIPKYLFDLLDNLFEMEKKVNKLSEPNSIIRNVSRMKEIMHHLDAVEHFGLSYDSPFGESYNETRTDLEAKIVGTSANNLVVTDVIKPIIRLRIAGTSVIARKGVVIVESVDR